MRIPGNMKIGEGQILNDDRTQYNYELVKKYLVHVEQLRHESSVLWRVCQVFLLPLVEPFFGLESVE